MFVIIVNWENKAFLFNAVHRDPKTCYRTLQQQAFLRIDTNWYFTNRVNKALLKHYPAHNHFSFVKSDTWNVQTFYKNSHFMPHTYLYTLLLFIIRKYQVHYSGSTHIWQWSCLKEINRLCPLHQKSPFVRTVKVSFQLKQKCKHGFARWTLLFRGLSWSKYILSWIIKRILDGIILSGSMSL